MAEFLLPPGQQLSLSAEDFRPPDSSRDNYAFVLNVSTLLDVNTLTLAPGHELRRADAVEISEIKETLYSQMPDLKLLNPWELQKQDDGQFVTLPESEWRYFVIGFRGTNTTLCDIQSVCLFARLQLKIGFTVIQWPLQTGVTRALQLHPGQLFQHLQDARYHHEIRMVKVTASDSTEIAALVTQFQQLDQQSEVRRTVRGLLDLESLPHYSPVLFLGYFALLESLLTHKPDPKDPLDSITRQVKNKIALLDNRFPHRLNYSNFGTLKPDAVWAKMYDYRSHLAHGDTPDFKGKLSALGNHGNALDLLQQSVAATVRQALLEPQLLTDLRNC